MIEDYEDFGNEMTHEDAIIPASVMVCLISMSILSSRLYSFLFPK